MSRYLLLWLLVGVAVVASGQLPSPRNHLVEHLLPGTENVFDADIKRCFKDRLGYYWMIAYKGIYRYDGKSVRYYPNDGISARKLNTIGAIQDAAGDIWLFDSDRGHHAFHASGGGLLLLDPATLSFQEKNLSNEKVVVASSDVSGAFIVTDKNNVYEVSASGFRFCFTAPQGIPIDKIERHPHSGRLYYLACNDLWEYHNGRHRQLTQSDLVRNFWLGRSAILLSMHRSGRDFNRLLRVYNIPTGRLLPLDPIFEQKSSCVGGNGQNEWFIYNENNEYLLTLKEDATVAACTPLFNNGGGKPAIYDKAIYAAHIDGNYWVFSYRTAKLVRSSASHFDAYWNDTQAISIRDIAYLHDSTLLVSSYSGAKCLNLKTAKVEKSPFAVFDATKDFVYGWLVLRDTVYGGSHTQGYYKYSTAAHKAELVTFDLPFFGTISRALPLPFAQFDDHIWFGIEGGIAKAPVVPGGSPSAVRHPRIGGLRQAKVEGYCAHHTRPHHYWLATDKGLYLLDVATETTVDSVAAWQGTSVKAVSARDSSSIWVFANNAAPCIYDTRSGRIDSLPIYRDVWKNTFHAALPDRHGCWWLPSDNGLFRYNPRRPQQFWRFTPENSDLPFHEFNRLAWETLPDGRLALGGVGGMVIFDPADFLYLDAQVTTHQVLWQSCAITTQNNRQTLDMADVLPRITGGVPIVLPANVGQFEVDFDASNTIGEDKRYFFRILPADGQLPVWTEISTGKVTLTELDYGTHTLQVGVKRGFGEAFLCVDTLLYQRLRPWYLSWWAWCLWALGAAGVVAAIVRIYTRQLQRRNAELSVVVSEKTAHLEAERAQLAEQTDELTRINTAKDKLFALLGHELQRPMLGVTQLSQKAAFLIRQQELDELALLSTRIDQNVDDTRMLLQNLLNWGQVMTEQAAPKLQPVAVATVLQQAHADLAAPWDNKELQLVSDIPPPGILLFDPDGLHILLRNLLHNALKFSPVGGTIRVALAPIPEGWCLSVEDQGAGFPPDMLALDLGKHVVESQKGTRGEHGSGLGLHLCHSIVVRHNGRVVLENTPEGHGRVCVVVGG